MYTNVCKHCCMIFKSRYKTYSCQECKEKDEEQFEDIILYLREYPNSNALQISDALGITAYEVLNYLKEGRLNITSGNFERLPD